MGITHSTTRLIPTESTEYTPLHPSSSPISRVPVEIMRRIFSCLHDLIETVPFGSGRTPSCIAVIHVCARWRQTALHHKALWTTIPLESREWTMVSLALSSPFPIHVPSRPTDPDPEAVRLVLKELPRIRQLSLELEDLSLLAAMLPAIRHHGAPLLETLFLWESCLNSDHNPFLTEGLPALKRLFLDRCSLPNPPFFPSRLTALAVTDCYIWDTYEQCFETLSCLPNLEKLDIRRSLSLSLDLSILALPKSISLPRLQELVLWGSLQELVTLANLLRLPPRMALIALICDLVQGVNHAVTERMFAECIAQLFLQDWVTQDFYAQFQISLDYDHWEERRFVRIQASEARTESGRSKLPRDLNVRLMMPPSSPNSWSGVSDRITTVVALHAMRHPVLCRPETLHLQSSLFGYYPMLWSVELSAVAKRLRKLHVLGSTALGLTFAFDSRGPDDAEFAFPELQTLYIHGLHFCCGGCFCQNRGVDEGTLEAVKQQQNRQHFEVVLCDCNRWRKVQWQKSQQRAFRCGEHCKTRTIGPMAWTLVQIRRRALDLCQYMYG